MTIETQLKSLEDALTAVTTDKESKPRPEEEKQKEIDLKKKEALVEGEKQKETEHKKESAEEEKKKELNAAIEMATSAKDKKIESLTAAVNYLTAKPIIDEMLEARRMAGMQQDALEGFFKVPVRPISRGHKAAVCRRLYIVRKRRHQTFREHEICLVQ